MIDDILICAMRSKLPDEQYSIMMLDCTAGTLFRTQETILAYAEGRNQDNQEFFRFVFLSEVTR